MRARCTGHAVTWTRPGPVTDWPCTWPARSAAPGTRPALAGLGRCALAAGHTASAQTSLRQAQEIFRRTGAAETSGVTAELSALTQAGPPAEAR
jgi:hypothetical protein